MLVVVVGVGWKCTPRGHEPLHALFGLGDFRRPRSGRRHRSHHRREGRWHGGKTKAYGVHYTSNVIQALNGLHLFSSTELPMFIKFTENKRVKCTRDSSPVSLLLNPFMASVLYVKKQTKKKKKKKGKAVLSFGQF